MTGADPRHGRRSDAPTGVTGPIATRWAVAGIQNRARGTTGKHRKRRWFSRA